MMGHREQMKGGAEFDAFTCWRKMMRWRPGEVKAVKRGFWKRQRREVRLANARAHSGD